MGFQTPQFRISTLLEWCATGKIQLPDFQREYRWDDERIRQLLVTILRGHPMGVIMVLETGNDQVRFKPKPLAGASSAQGEPAYLLLDGQQRMTSMYQAFSGGGVVETQDDRKKRLNLRYFLDIEKALGTPSDQDDAVMAVPADGKIKENFDRDIRLDLSTTDLQQRHGMLPVTEFFGANLTGWMLAYCHAVPEDRERRLTLFNEFNNRIAVPMASYEIPAIQLDSATSKEAVATVFEKVNTGGLPLDVFELLTATFAGDAAYFSEHGVDFRLGEDWERTKEVIAEHPVLSGLQRTDFLQAVTLLATRERHDGEVVAGKARPAAISARREDILQLQLADYLHWAPQVRDALAWVAMFLTSQHVHDQAVLPYRTQVVPLAVFRVVLGPDIDIHTIRERVTQWYWCGVLGELYGSTTETRFARDTEQVPVWARAAVSGTDAAPPDTVRDAYFQETRLLTLKTRGSAAYKGLYALIMRGSCRDWKLDQQIEHSTYLQMQVDIHHIFPKLWCEQNHIEPHLRESIVNKTPLAKRTNIFLRGESPRDYITRLERVTGLSATGLDAILREHLVEPAHLRGADFNAFFDARWQAILGLVSQAMGKAPVLDRPDTHPDATRLAEAATEYEEEPDDPEDDLHAADPAGGLEHAGVGGDL